MMAPTSMQYMPPKRRALMPPVDMARPGPPTQPHLGRAPNQGTASQFVFVRTPATGPSTTRSVRGTTGWTRSSPPTSTRTPGDITAGTRPRAGTVGAATGGGSRSVSQSPRSSALSVERTAHHGSASHSPNPHGMSRGQSGGLRPMGQTTAANSLPPGPQRSASGATLCRSNRKASSKAPTRAKSPSLHTRERHRRKCETYSIKRENERGLTPEGSLSPRSISGLPCQGLRQERSPPASCTQNCRGDMVRLEAPTLLMGSAAPIQSAGPSRTGSVASTPRPSPMPSPSPTRVPSEVPEVLYQQPAMSSATTRKQQIVSSPQFQKPFYSHQPPPSASQTWLSTGPPQAPPSPGPGSDPHPRGRGSPPLAPDHQHTPTRQGGLTECATNSPRRVRSSDHMPSRTRSPRGPGSAASPASPSDDDSVSFKLSPIRKMGQIDIPHGPKFMDRAPSAPSLLGEFECMGPAAASLTLSSVSSHRESLTQPPDILQGSDDHGRELRGQQEGTARSSKETTWPPSSNVTEDREPSVGDVSSAQEGAEAEEQAVKPTSPAISTTSSGNNTTSSKFMDVKNVWEDRIAQNKGNDTRAVSQPASRANSRSGSHSGSNCNSRSNSQSNLQLPPSRESSQPRRRRDRTPQLQRRILNTRQRIDETQQLLACETLRPWLGEMDESSPESNRPGLSDSDASPGNSQGSGSAAEEESLFKLQDRKDALQNKLIRRLVRALNNVGKIAVEPVRSSQGSSIAVEPGANEISKSSQGSERHLEPEPLAEPGSSSDGQTAGLALKIDSDEAPNPIQAVASPTRRRIGVAEQPPFQAPQSVGSQPDDETLQGEGQQPMMHPLSPVPQTQSSGEASPASTPSPEGITPLSALNEARLLSEIGSPVSGEFANNTSQPGHLVQQETSRTVSGNSHLSSPQLEFPSRMMETIGQLDGASPSGASTTAGSMSHEGAGADVTDFSVGGPSSPCSPTLLQRATSGEPNSPQTEPRHPTNRNNLGSSEDAVQPPSSSSGPSSSEAGAQPQEAPTTPQRNSTTGQSNSPESRAPPQLDVERLRTELQAYPDLMREICDLGGLEQPQLKLLFLRACIMEPGPDRRMELWAQVSRRDRRRLLEAMQLTGAQLQSCLSNILNAPDSDGSAQSPASTTSNGPQSPMQPERRETSVSPSGSAGSADGSQRAIESPEGSARLGQSPPRPHLSAGSWGIPRNESFLHQIEHNELVQHVRVRMPQTISKGQRLQFVHAGKRHEVEVPEGAMPGQEILYEVRKWPAIDRSLAFTQRRGWAFTHGIDRQTLTTQLRQTPSMALTGATNWQEITNQLVQGVDRQRSSDTTSAPQQDSQPQPQPQNQPPQMLRHPFFQQRRDFYRHLRGRAMDPLLTFMPEEDPSEIEDVHDEHGFSSSSDMPQLPNITSDEV